MCMPVSLQLFKLIIALYNTMCKLKISEVYPMHKVHQTDVGPCTAMCAVRHWPDGLCALGSAWLVPHTGFTDHVCIPECICQCGAERFF